jgi:hypothetical protein
VLDKNLKVLSEHFFSLDKYNFFNQRAFVGQRGLYVEGAPADWVKKNNYQYHEDTLLLMCFTLKPGPDNE